MSRRAQTRMVLPHPSQPWWCAGLLVDPAASELGPCSSPSTPSPKTRFFVWRDAKNDAGHRQLWFTHALLLQPDWLQKTGDGSTVIRLHRRPQRHRILQGVSIERHLSRIFPARPRSLASVLIPRPAALGVLLRPCGRPSGLGFQIKNLLWLRPLRGEIFSSEPPQKDTPSTLGAGHLASLRARVSRGQSGQIQTGEKQWHSTKTTSS